MKKRKEMLLDQVITLKTDFKPQEGRGSGLISNSCGIDTNDRMLQ